jgi:purine-binding chemotaxis protein CheW
MDSKQLVVFILNQDEYGIEISYVQEIVRVPEQITKIPDAPSFIEGLMNLRGKVIPVLDLKKRYGFTEKERNGDNRLLILNLENSFMGVVVDDVSEVLHMDTGQIEDICAEIRGYGSSIKGICKVDNRLILLLDALKMKRELVENNYTKEMTV